ncbi:MAG: glutamate racemase [Ktedonobacterales bacterium]|nr:glutamate racemase [Ktedonobacterales bacterium]
MASAREAPIGVFDSGVGGLTVLRELLRELPDERYLYFGDTGNCPYGVRSVDQIQRLSLTAAHFLVERQAKLVVVACNTASVSARTQLRAAFPVPFVVVVPAIKPAAAMTYSGHVGIAATEASARGDYLRTLVREHARGVDVLAVGCPQLVRLAEAGVLTGPDVEAAIRESIQPMLDAGIDVLVLGCTHFPAMRDAFERVVGPAVRVIDSGAAIARQARRVLDRAGLLAPSTTGPLATPRPLTAEDTLWCSGDLPAFERAASAILDAPVRAHVALGMLVPSDTMPPGAAI